MGESARRVFPRIWVQKSSDWLVSAPPGVSSRGQGSLSLPWWLPWSLRRPPAEDVEGEVDMALNLGPVPLERQARGLPVDQTAGVVADVLVTVLAQLLDRRQAGVAVEVRAIDDDLLVLAQRGEHLLRALEVDRPGEMLGPKRPVAGGHYQLEGILARQLGLQLLTIEIGGSWLGAGHCRDLAGRRP